MTIEENDSLAAYTTIKLGGPARYVATCGTVHDLHKALAFAHDRQIPAHILGGGSNTIFPDEGYPGVVIRMTLKGIAMREKADSVLVTAQAGEEWDSLVARCVVQGYAGLECLSGIPGLVGATPIQNVGAYGQAVADTIVKVVVLERTTEKLRTFSNKECRFGYRTSRFKLDDAGRYIITSVTFQLRRNGAPTMTYPQLRAALAARRTLDSLKAGPEALKQVRDTVLALRREKSMVVSNNDPHTRSCGSFFVNPVLTQEQCVAMKQRAQEVGIVADTMPVFPIGDSVKIAAAWLIERVGFTRGQRQGGVGISANHALALVNYNGTAKELLKFADTINQGVYEKFGIVLEREPIVVATTKKC